MEKIQQLAGMLMRARRIVFFGGAGVSTESGLKDYRSPDGIYRTARDYGLPPEEILSHSCFIKNPALFYRFFRDYFTGQAQPNRAHLALAALEKTGRQVTIVTQNIDGLHQKAGSSCVYELHGSCEKFRCVECGREYGTDCLQQEGVPHCGCGGIIRPLVTLYQERLENSVIDGAIGAIAAADLLIIGGTSLAVQPAASFVTYFQGENTVVINKEETPYDSKADMVFHQSIGEVIGQAVQLCLKADV